MEVIKHKVSWLEGFVTVFSHSGHPTGSSVGYDEYDRKALDTSLEVKRSRGFVKFILRVREAYSKNTR